MKPSKVQALVDALWEEQLANWSLLKKGCEGLGSVLSHPISYAGVDFRVQYNPARIRSSAAKVDSKSINERPCFLCPHALPAEQKGLLLLGKYLVLSNPYPILQRHLTIPDLEHLPQEIAPDRIADMVTLAEYFRGSLDVYFNGARAGASAPDHFHFQAGAQGSLPLCQQPAGQVLYQGEGYSIYTAEESPRTVLLVEAQEAAAMALAYQRIDTLIPDRDLVNMVMSHDGNRLRLWIVLRSKHRPNCFFVDGEQHRLISPGVVDMCGVAVLVREEDYQGVDGELWYRVMQEVSLPKQEFGQIIQQIQSWQAQE